MIHPLLDLNIDDLSPVTRAKVLALQTTPAELAKFLDSEGLLAHPELGDSAAPILSFSTAQSGS